MNYHPNLDIAGSNHSKNSPSAIVCACNDHQVNIKVFISDRTSVFDSYLPTQINNKDMKKAQQLSEGGIAKSGFWQCRK